MVVETSFRSIRVIRVIFKIHVKNVPTNQSYSDMNLTACEGKRFIQSQYHYPSTLCNLDINHFYFLRPFVKGFRNFFKTNRILYIIM